MRAWLVGLLIMLVLAAFMINAAEVKGSQTDEQTQKIEKMVDFLINTQFNDNLGLCREAPNVAPNRYWLASDNLWAWKALSMAGNDANLSNAGAAASTASKIKATITTLAANYSLPTDSEGLPISYCHEAVIGDQVQPPYKTNNPLTLYSDGYTLKTDMRNGTDMSDWTNYSDLLLYGALSYHWQNNNATALSYYNMAVGMWNETSQGLQDTVNTNFTTGATTGDYSTFKVALLLYVSNLLGQDPSFKSELVNKLYAQQSENGGIITDYYANSTWVEGADVNTETTSIVIIALLTTPPQTSQPNINPLEITVVAIALIVAILLTAVLVLKRPFKHFSRRTQRQVFAKFNFMYGFVIGNFAVDKIY